MLSVFGGAEGLGRLPILIGSGFQFVINTPFSVFVLGHALSPVFPFTNRQGEYGYSVSQSEYNSQQKKYAVQSSWLALTFLTFWLKINHHISLSANSHKVARYIIVCFYIKVYINGSPSEDIHQVLAWMVQRERPVRESAPV